MTTNVVLNLRHCPSSLMLYNMHTMCLEKLKWGWGETACKNESIYFIDGANLNWDISSVKIVILTLKGGGF